MNDSTPTITRYLLGELSEREQAALEEQYFADPRVFDEVAAAETALVDDYVRGRLPSDLRRRFEQTYLADARRRNRVRFAEALAARVDQAGAQPGGHGLRQPLTPDLEPVSGWPSWLAVLWPSKPRLGLAVATVLLASTGTWLAIQFGQDREDASRVWLDGTGRNAPRPRPAPPNRRAPRSRDHRLGPPTRRSRRPAPGPPKLPTPTFATLILTVGGGERGREGGRPPTLVIPPGTSDVRVQLRLREHEHPSYRIVLRAIGGPEILRRADLRPAAEGPGAVLAVVVPASLFSAGDYMLTLQGAAGVSEFDDLSQSLFRVERP